MRSVTLQVRVASWGKSGKLKPSGSGVAPRVGRPVFGSAPCTVRRDDRTDFESKVHRMSNKPNPRRAIANRLQDTAQMLAGNAASVGSAPVDLLGQNVSFICLELELAGKLARELQDRETSIVIEECRAELRTHVLWPAGVINLPGLVGVAERCSPKLLAAYARIVTAGPKKRRESTPPTPQEIKALGDVIAKMGTRNPTRDAVAKAARRDGLRLGNAKIGKIMKLPKTE